MSKLADRLNDLKSRCLRCWADEVSDIFPQTYNTELASKVMEEHGNPPHKCKSDTDELLSLECESCEAKFSSMTRASLCDSCSLGWGK